MELLQFYLVQKHHPISSHLTTWSSFVAKETYHTQYYHMARNQEHPATPTSRFNHPGAPRMPGPLSGSMGHLLIARTERSV